MISRSQRRQELFGSGRIPVPKTPAADFADAKAALLDGIKPFNVDEVDAKDKLLAVSYNLVSRVRSAHIQARIDYNALKAYDRFTAQQYRQCEGFRTSDGLARVIHDLGRERYDSVLQELFGNSIPWALTEARVLAFLQREEMIRAYLHNGGRGRNGERYDRNDTRQIPENVRNMSSTQSTPEIGADSPNSPSGDRFHLDQVTPEPSSKSLKRKKKVEDLKFEQKWGRKLNEMTEHEFGETVRNAKAEYSGGEEWPGDDAIAKVDCGRKSVADAKRWMRLSHKRKLKKELRERERQQRNGESQACMASGEGMELQWQAGGMCCWKSKR
ncbi:MAG: hypothetical protein L6R40_004592 [Gallowayella cf. fulva]|nr:MAG: hypothetical protein L6R40_004592 [Xanthomendoza cf. fulva]